MIYFRNSFADTGWNGGYNMDPMELAAQEVEKKLTLFRGRLWEVKKEIAMEGSLEMKVEEVRLTKEIEQFELELKSIRGH